jgi:dTDP-glucose 4,6-dehydratase
MRFIVTGGCGFVGSAVVRSLVERGDRVLNIDRKRKASQVPALAPINGREGYARLEADISDRALMRAIFREFKPEKVIHLASSIGDDADALFDAEVAGSFSVLEASRQGLLKLEGAERDAFRFVHAVRAGMENEFAPSPREAARNAAAALVTEWSRSHHVQLVTCVADAVFGPWQGEAAMLPGLVAALLGGREYALEAGGERVRDWLPIKDFADGLIRAADMGRPMGRYEFTVGAERRDLDMAEAACAMLDARAPANQGSWASMVQLEGEAEDAPAPPLLDSVLAESELAWRPQGFHAGLERALVWAIDRYKPPETITRLAAE